MSTAEAGLDVHIRWMIRRDMPGVQAIEEAGFPEPWTPGEFLGHLRRRTVIGMVAVAADRVVGFMVYEMHGRRLELLNLAVEPASRRRRVGRRMVDRLLGKLSARRRTTLAARAWEGNLGAHLFLRACGLRAVGVVADAHEDGESDYLFEHTIGGAS